MKWSIRDLLKTTLSSKMASKLWIVTAISNPVGYVSRYALYREFRRHIVEELGANLLTVELAIGERPFEITESRSGIFQAGVGWGSEIHVQERCSSEIWHKENLLNVGFSRLPIDCEYIAWLDADVRFLNRNIVQDTIAALQIYPVVQLFQHCIDLGPKGEAMDIHTSFGLCYQRGDSINVGGDNYGGPFWHTGYAWAARRRELNLVGGLLERSLLGAADHHMALAMIGEARLSIHGGTSDAYKAMIENWQVDALRVFQRRVGYVEGTIAHSFHGFKKHRGYYSRWSIIVDHGFDPIRDLRRNLSGVLDLRDTAPEQMRVEISAYFRQRNEDATVDLDGDAVLPREIKL